MTTAEAKAKDTSYQVNKAVCYEPGCGWMYIATRDEHWSIAIARGRTHGHQFGHHVRLKQDIVDLDIQQIWPVVSICEFPE